MIGAAPLLQGGGNSLLFNLFTPSLARDYKHEVFMIALVLWLLQETPDTGSDNTTMIRVIAGAAALAIIAVILVRRKKKTSKEDWS
jgi:LPXTG-motif cell wall-anchored protein